MSEFDARQVRASSSDLIKSASPDRAVPQPTHLAGQEVSNQAAQRFAQSCPLRLPSPSACLFGGACHACPARVQTKLTVNRPGDEYEQEADQVAEQVMRMPKPRVQRQEDEPIQAKPLAEQITPLVQRQVEPEDEDEEPIQTKLAESAQVQRQEEGPEEEEEEPIQAKRAAGQTPQASPGLANQIRSLNGAGQPLPRSARDFFEPRLGCDFSQVRVHTGPRAAAVSRALNAQAFTLGRDVVFGSGQYELRTAAGQRLLAHELAHVIQNRGSTSGIRRRVRAGSVSCRNPSRATRRVTGANPVSTIQGADRRAIELLDDVIGKLYRTRRAIRRGAPIAPPTIADCVARGLRQQFGLNPNSRRIWTSRGRRSVYIIIRRFRAARRILNGGWMKYTCLGPRRLRWRSCSGPGCVSTATSETDAFSCAGILRIWLCRPWWNRSLDEKALTLIHEALHIYFSNIGDTGRLANAYSYERFIRSCRV